MNALSVPLALATGVQKADFVPSMVLFAVLQAVAVAAVAPIFSVPVDTALTTNEVTEPSTSASLPLLRSSAKEIETEVSSLVALTELLKDVSVGRSLTTGAVNDALVREYPLKPMPSGMVMGTILG